MEKDLSTGIPQDRGQTVEVVLPQMGEGVLEATFVKCLKSVGDQVRKDEPLFEVSTDKVDTEIPSPADGVVVQIVAKEGETVAVSSPVIILRGSLDPVVDLKGAPSNGAPGPSFDTSAPPQPTPPVTVRTADQPKQDPNYQPDHPTNPTPARFEDFETSDGTDQGRDERIDQPTVTTPLSSPLVRKVARDRKVDLGQVVGSGLGGRIVLRDLETAKPGHRFEVRNASPKAQNHEAQALPQALPQELPSLVTKTIAGQETLDGVVVRREKMSKMRGLIAEHMVRSVRTSPHVTTVFEIDVHRLAQLRKTHQARIKEREGFGLTYTAFFAYAAAKTIKKFPIVNVSVDGDHILWKDTINLGIAVAIETGLIVPVIRNAGDLNLLGVARQINLLAQRARSKKLTPEDVQGGTFSITNPGMFGSLVSAPIINQPQVAILSIGAIVKRPVVLTLETPTGTQEVIAIRPLVQVGLTFDHRVIDGEGGSRFLADFKDTIENFAESEVGS